jgi:LPS sulfotransferase NodH
MNEKLLESNIWVLSNYRNGSNFLCRLLESFGNLPGDTFSEKFNPYRSSTLKKYYKDTFFNNSYRKWKNGDVNTRRNLFFKHVIKKQTLPQKMKFMRDQFFEVCGLNDNDKRLVESELPDLKYIFLKRSDIYRVTVSLYFAQKTGKWVLQERERGRYLDIPVEFNEDEILGLFKRMRHFTEENNWDKYLRESDYLFVDFQDLIKDPTRTFIKVMNYLEIDPNEVDIERYVNAYKFVPTKRPEMDEYIRRLRKLVSSRFGKS